jgi:hypothetical protein
MLYHQHDLHNSHQQKQHDIFAQLRAYRQQLVIWHQEMAAIEQRLTVFRQRQQTLQTQLERWHRERNYFLEHTEQKERKQYAWQYRHRHNGSF